MAKLDESEIKPGLVVFLDQAMLTADPAVKDTLPQTANTEPRPFVCLEVQDRISTWAPLTRQYRYERLKIESAWKHGGTDDWRKPTSYLNDGANVYIGPNSAFVAASYAETSTAGDRAWLSSEGLKAVQAEVATQVRRRVNP